MNTQELRNLVSETFDIDPKQVRLGEEPLSPDFIPQDDCGHSWSDETGECYQSVWGFDARQILGSSPIVGLTEGKAGGDWVREYSFSQNGDPVHSAGESLIEYLDRTDQSTRFAFFILWQDEKPYGRHQERVQVWTIHRAADYAAHLAALESADVARWQQFFELAA